MAKTAVLIHGCHLEAVGWENIVWGNPREGILGRAPRGLLEAYRRDAALVIWGTGASQKDGKKESRYTFDYTMGRLGELATIPVSGPTYPVEPLRGFLLSRSALDIETQNTTEEIRAALDLCTQRGIEELYLVSSPTHVARCLQEATKLLAERGNNHDVLVYATPSDTCFADSTPADVVIVEPPHRGDMPLWQTYRYVRAMFGILRQGSGRFQGFLFDLGDLLKKYGVKVDWKPFV